MKTLRIINKSKYQAEKKHPPPKKKQTQRQQPKKIHERKFLHRSSSMGNPNACENGFEKLPTVKVIIW